MAKGKLETLVERDVCSETGKRWHVREVSAHDVPGAEGYSCLIFDSGKVCRRYWSYPARWAELADVAILAMMDPHRND